MSEVPILLCSQHLERGGHPGGDGGSFLVMPPHAGGPCGLAHLHHTPFATSQVWLGHSLRLLEQSETLMILQAGKCLWCVNT